MAAGLEMAPCRPGDFGGSSWRSPPPAAIEAFTSMSQRRRRQTTGPWRRCAALRTPIAASTSCIATARAGAVSSAWWTRTAPTMLCIAALRRVAAASSARSPAIVRLDPSVMRPRTAASGAAPTSMTARRLITVVTSGAGCASGAIGTSSAKRRRRVASALRTRPAASSAARTRIARPGWSVMQCLEGAFNAGTRATARRGCIVTR
jgi:hypothetical protein